MSEGMKVEGEPDPKPYKLYRVDSEGREIQPRIAEYATEGDLRAHERRLDWRYSYFCGRERLPDK